MKTDRIADLAYVREYANAIRDGFRTVADDEAERLIRESHRAIQAAYVRLVNVRNARILEESKNDI